MPTRSAPVAIPAPTLRTGLVGGASTTRRQIGASTRRQITAG
jgi:hypothetical protein